MSTPKIDAYYQQIKNRLLDHHFQVNPYREINYGVQFIVFLEDSSGIIRVYDGKKGLKLDLSQIKDEALKEKVNAALSEETSYSHKGRLLEFIPPEPRKNIVPEEFKTRSTPTTDPDELIGMDESGKGDYFGPLVTAAVYVNPDLARQLTELGVADSKSLSDFKNIELAEKIKTICPHSLVIMAPKSYNDIYSKIGNLNHILAWAHTRTLGNVLKKIECQYALLDQFANPKLIQSSLLSSGLDITVYQRPRAETNIAVAAASILARGSFLEELQALVDAFKHSLPKGASQKVVDMAQRFVYKYDKDHLVNVAKLHFKITEQLKENPRKDAENTENTSSTSQ